MGYLSLNHISLRCRDNFSSLTIKWRRSAKVHFPEVWHLMESSECERRGVCQGSAIIALRAFLNYSKLSGLFFIKELPPSHFSQQELQQERENYWRQVCDTLRAEEELMLFCCFSASSLHLMLFPSGCPLITCKVQGGTPFYNLSA